MTLLLSALAAAMSKVTDADRTQVLHTQRSRTWVAALAGAFRKHYGDDPDVRVLSKYDASHQAEFGLNELLYDVLVCRVGMAPAARHNTTLIYVREALWQVESEFAPNSREAVYDFNKLVLGTAPHKLFVGPQVSDEAGFLAALLPVARCCSGDVYAALVPHPADWGTGQAAVRVWRWLFLDPCPVITTSLPGNKACPLEDGDDLVAGVESSRARATADSRGITCEKT